MLACLQCIELEGLRHMGIPVINGRVSTARETINIIVHVNSSRLHLLVSSVLYTAHRTNYDIMYRMNKNLNSRKPALRFFR